MSVTDTSPLAKGSYEPVAWNFKLLAQHELQGFGGMGEGMSMQIAPDGRRILWLAHESAPKNFTGVDVSDPRKPKVVVQTDLPQPHMRSNSLEVTDNVMAVAYQTQKVGLATGGFRAVRHLGAREAEVDRFLRLLRPQFARRASALVLRRRVHPSFRRRARLHAHASERRSVLPHLRRAQYQQAGRGRPLVAARHARGRQRAAARAPSQAAARPRQPRPQHQCVSGPSGPLLSRLRRCRHVHHGHFRQVEAQADQPLGQFAALYGLHPHGGAAVRSQAPDRHRRIRPSTTPPTGPS